MAESPDLSLSAASVDGSEDFGQLVQAWVQSSERLIKLDTEVPDLMVEAIRNTADFIASNLR